MREHGVLNRVLIIYDEAARRLEKGEDAKEREVIIPAAKLVRRFIEDYHARQEEDFVFPRLEKAGKHVELVKVLRAQHDAGRELTHRIELHADGMTRSFRLGMVLNTTPLLNALRSFVRMYRPHEAREDTVLFPALHEMMSEKEWDALGDRFEEREHALFGAHGFEDAVAEVAALEKLYGLDDLASFTPGG